MENINLTGVNELQITIECLTKELDIYNNTLNNKNKEYDMIRKEIREIKSQIKEITNVKDRLLVRLDSVKKITMNKVESIIKLIEFDKLKEECEEVLNNIREVYNEEQREYIEKDIRYLIEELDELINELVEDVTKLTSCVGELSFYKQLTIIDTKKAQVSEIYTNIQKELKYCKDSINKYNGFSTDDEEDEDYEDVEYIDIDEDYEDEEDYIDCEDEEVNKCANVLGAYMRNDEQEYVFIDTKNQELKEEQNNDCDIDQRTRLFNNTLKYINEDYINVLNIEELEKLNTLLIDTLIRNKTKTTLCETSNVIQAYRDITYYSDEELIKSVLCLIDNRIKVETEK